MISALIVMTAISFCCRSSPFILFNWFKGWPVLEKISTALPASILILLVAHNLEHSGCGTPEIAGLLAVAVSQIFFRSVLASMSIGVLLHQYLLRI